MRRDVVQMVREIKNRPAPYQARNVLGHTRTFFNWAIGQAMYGIETSPCDRLKPRDLIGPAAPRERVLTDDEIRALWNAAGTLGYPMGAVYRLLLLTGQRKGEIAGARWREFHPDLRRVIDEKIDWRRVRSEVKLLTIPSERFKSGATHLVPMSDDALAVVAEIPTFADCDLLFTTDGKRAVNGFSKSKRRLDELMLAKLRERDPKAKLQPFVVHDIRRTVRTRLSGLKVEERVAEMVIGHGKKGLKRVYDQHEYVAEMREALEAWAARLRSIVQPPPENVVPMRGRGRRRA